MLAFLVVIQSLITFVHWVVYRSMSHYFSWSGSFDQKMFWLFLGLSCTFLITNVATRYLSNDVIRAAYFGAAVWLGTIHFLFLGAVLLALLELMSSFLLHPVPVPAAIFIYVGALTLSLVSLLHARDIAVVQLPLSLPHLPAEWKGKKVVFFADTHYGNIHREKAAERVAQLIEEEQPSLVLMGGDFFDGPPIDADLVTYPYRNLTSRVPTFFVSGNHEEYGKKAEFLQSLEGNGFRIINDQKVLLDGLQIVGLDFMTTRTAAATSMTLQHLALDTTLPTIVLKHIPRFQKEISQAGGHLMLSGHTHRGQMFPFNFITSLIYGGFDYGLKPFASLLTYTTSGAGSWGPPQRLGTQTEIVVFTLE